MAFSNKYIRTRVQWDLQWDFFSRLIWDKADGFQMGYTEAPMNLCIKMHLIFTKKWVSYWLLVSSKSHQASVFLSDSCICL